VDHLIVRTYYRFRDVEITLIGKLDCVPVDLAVAGIGDVLLEYSFMTRHRGSEWVADILEHVTGDIWGCI
jgi:hypothetical protein